MQTEFDLHYPSSKVQILGINQRGFEQGNESITDGRDIPWLQDVDGDGDGKSDVWLNSWDYEYRDVVLVDADGGALDVYNLTSNDLSESAKYEELKQRFIDVADLEQKTRWQSPIEPLDVDGNSRISPIDALHVVNELGKHAGGVLPQLGDVTNYVDTDGDGRVGPLDALLVINQLNVIAAASAQAAPLSSVATASAVPTAESLVVEIEPATDVLSSVSVDVEGDDAESGTGESQLAVSRYRYVSDRVSLLSNSIQDSARDELFRSLDDVRLL